MSRFYDNVKGNLELTLKESCVLSIVLIDDVSINYDLKDGDYKILIFNNANKAIKVIEKGSITNSNVEINYLELNHFDFIQKNNIEVLSGSNLTINSTYLGCNTKRIDFNLINKQRDTTINISNNVVCLKDSDFVLNVVGKIVKGAKNSKCFQKSRCLTFDNPKKAKVLPVLEIDENDVEASHSLSSGTIDEDVLFYMNSRGLTKNEALALLLVSYLMPNEDFYKTFDNGDLIKEIADKKVEKICSR